MPSDNIKTKKKNATPKISPREIERQKLEVEAKAKEEQVVSMDELKCIKDRCKYYTKHLYSTSTRICSLTDFRMRSNEEYDCVVNEKIRKMEFALEKLGKYKRHIVDVNLKRVESEKEE